MPQAHLDVSVHINASAKQVFDRMSDLSRFNDWNPFPAMDPTTVSRHEGPDSGVGAVFSYEGKRLGKGRMEIVSVDAPREIEIAMTFWRGKNESHSESAFVIVDAPGGGVTVHWVVDEDRGALMWLMGRLVFDKMMSGTFTDGLTQLKELVETA